MDYEIISISSSNNKGELFFWHSEVPNNTSKLLKYPSGS